MATPAAPEPPPEVLSWLKTLPLAPEYHPTLSEFQDPISYIFKIEKEASKFGICKIVPPVPPPPKKSAIANLNKSLAARATFSSPKSQKTAPTFTTRQQQIGFCPRRHRPVQRPVWQSGEYYTFQEFEAKAKSFERNYLKKCPKKSLSALEFETLFWKACVDKPFSVEYANDMPGSAFVPVNAKKKDAGEAMSVGETNWNMRAVSRAKGSLLRFMKEEIPGVTSPMVYIAMMFSWFAWHVEDHDLHSLNYLHMGAGKTWYGVPRDAAVAFEEVVRVQGYSGEINPLVTFAILGEKTTVMSPEVFISAGIPCCRLVQNPGEFVVTFPRAYHSGFSHGFNCGEAANIATPEWLRVAKDAAIRRASINYPPMVSHFQLLYDLALALCSSIPMSISAEPRSSRLKNKKKGEGESVIKELFVQDVIKNNDLLQILGKGSPIALIPQNCSDISARSNLRVGSHMKLNPRLSLGLCSPEEAMKSSKSLIPDDMTLNRNKRVKQSKGLYSMRGKFSSSCERNELPSFAKNDDACTFTSQTQNADIKKESAAQINGVSEQGLFSCVTCGILIFACCAIVQPREAAARYFMSADCSFFNDWVVSSGVTSDEFARASANANTSEQNSSGLKGKSVPDGLYDVPIQSSDFQIQAADQSVEVVSDTETREGTSALGLLALAYGNSSDSEEDQAEPNIPVVADETNTRDCSSESRFQCDDSKLPSLKRDSHAGANGGCSPSFSKSSPGDEVPLQIIDSCEGRGQKNATFADRSRKAFGRSDMFESNNRASVESNSSEGMPRGPLSHITPGFSLFSHNNEQTKFSSATVAVENVNLSFPPRSDEDSSRVHVFCLEHAIEVEQQLRPIGGVQMLLACRPDYPKIEAEARLMGKDMGIDYLWNNLAFRDATKEDEERIQSALDSEEAIPGNGDWAVKLGINLFYSANLSRSPLYSKQMPYNSVIYNAFGRSPPAFSPIKPDDQGKGSGKQKKIVMVGKWCGKVWMSNQVHPLLAERNIEEHEPDRTFPAFGKHDEKPEKRSESSHKAETVSVRRRSGRKRKRTVERGSMKKAGSPENEDPVRASDDSADDHSHQQPQRILRTKQTKQETPRLRNSSEKNTRKLDCSHAEVESEGGPSTRLRKRIPKPSKDIETKPVVQKQLNRKKAKKAPAPKAQAVHKDKVPVSHKDKGPVHHKDAKRRDEDEEYHCDLEGCTMSFISKQDLVLHKRNICPVKGCGKKFFSHKYLVQHRRVHVDDRPLKCPWKGCKMTFKWAWARTEHIRVHTGARPYVCNEAGCGQTFRFVSDFSRHKRKTGHSTKKGRG
ncbi:lysine-specific demethylase REF6 isoform X2 [Malania oleifera]|uniref:lysine-specific demethylase REF6 isoform X2 n=1 Tax=Malania oleifera TaxID=397392 RepID=UPI0025AE591C|nr:lysine-specific demethylase REF6 isoform X2 [Malania oleifera]